MTARLVLVCQASTEATKLVRFGADEGLDAAGVVAAGAQAGTFGRVARVWCAPSEAARQTTGLLGFASFEVVPGLRDLDVGRWRGRSLADVQEDSPEAVGRWLADPASTPHGGESLLDLVHRVQLWLDRVCSTPGEGRMVAVASASVVRAALVAALWGNPEAFWRVDVGPLARTELRGNGGRWNLRSLGPMPR
jgi:broad specificity phosphatase PhoE